MVTDQIPKRSIRKLVTLPPDLAERVEHFRQTSGASSESDALKVLIEDGLKMRDKPEDLFRRCETASTSGQSIGDIINLLTSDHPLVESTVLDSESLTVYLKAMDGPSERFRYSRSRREWHWERHGDYDNWNAVSRETSQSQHGFGGGGFAPGPDLDDEIPF